MTSNAGTLEDKMTELRSTSEPENWELGSRYSTERALTRLNVFFFVSIRNLSGADPRPMWRLELICNEKDITLSCKGSVHIAVYPNPPFMSLFDIGSRTQPRLIDLCRTLSQTPYFTNIVDIRYKLQYVHGRRGQFVNINSRKPPFR